MKAETLISMMEQEEYQTLTCRDFAQIVKKSGVLEVPIIPDYMNKAIAEQSEKERRNENTRY